MKRKPLHKNTHKLSKFDDHLGKLLDYKLYNQMKNQTRFKKIKSNHIDLLRNRLHDQLHGQLDNNLYFQLQEDET
jgi:hypothetical protein